MATPADALRAVAQALEALAVTLEAPPQPAADQLLKDSEVAELLRLHPKRVCELRRSGQLPGIYISKRRPRTSRSAVERFKQARARA